METLAACMGPSNLLKALLYSQRLGLLQGTSSIETAIVRACIGKDLQGS